VDIGPMNGSIPVTHKEKKNAVRQKEKELRQKKK